MSLKSNIISVLKEFPEYIGTYLLGLSLAVISDITLTSLFIGSVAVGIVTTFWIGLAIFFLAYSIVQIVNAIDSAIVQHGRCVTWSSVRLARVFEDTSPAVNAVQDSSPEG